MVKIMKENNVKLELVEYYLAFLDVLGYKSKILNSTTSEEIDFLKKINDSFNEAIKSVKNEKTYNNELSKLKYKTFSDNIVLAIPKYNITPNVFLCFIKLIKNLCYFMLTKYRLLLRGGVVCGNYYQNDNISFGSALVRAYNLENTAVYPRIIFDKKIVDDLLLLNTKIDYSNEFRNSFFKSITGGKALRKFYDIVSKTLIKISFFHSDVLTQDVCNIINFLKFLKQEIQTDKMNFFSAFKKMNMEIIKIGNDFNTIARKSIYLFYKDYLINYKIDEDYYTLDYFEKNTSILIVKDESVNTKEFEKFRDGSFKFVLMYYKMWCLYSWTLNEFLIRREESINEMTKIRQFILKEISIENDFKVHAKYVWLKDFYNLHCKKNFSRHFITYDEYNSLVIV